MRMIDLITAPWALTPEALNEMKAVYDAHVRGEKIDLRAMQTELAARGVAVTMHSAYDVIDGVALIPVQGVLTRTLNFFSALMGGSSTVAIGDAFKQALSDDAVTSIVLDVDSPGGEVPGTEELAALIRGGRGQKPIIAHTAGMMASAAYWIGSAADQVLISGNTAMVGSIGVVATHYDQSRRLDAMGVRVTEIVAGKFKRAGSSMGPLDNEGREVIQSRVDALYAAFVEDVAINRGASVDVVLEDMADGRVFVGLDSARAGLVDGVATMSDVLGKLAASAGGGGPVSLFRAQDATEITEKEVGDDMDIKTLTAIELRAERPDLVEALTAEAVTLGANDAATLSAQAAETERERIRSVEAQCLPGHEALIDELKYDGKTTGEQAAVKVLALEKVKGSAELDRLRKDAADAADVSSADAGDGKSADDDAPKTFAEAVTRLMGEGKTRANATREAVSLYPELHRAMMGRAA